MNIRLIKSGMSPPDGKLKQLTAEVPIIETIRSWVSDFRSTRADRVRLDSERIKNPGKT
jgi:hypothetical protein